MDDRLFDTDPAAWLARAQGGEPTEAQRALLAQRAMREANELLHGTVYSDGGICQMNPSPYGGSWAWVAVSPSGEELASHSGAILPDGGPVTNNHSEMRAAVEALESRPAGWAGTLCTDSLNTLLRIRHRKASMKGLPSALVARLAAAKARLGAFSVELVKGHPTREDIARGRTEKGLRASRWNVQCDRMCGEENAALLPAPAEEAA